MSARIPTLLTMAGGAAAIVAWTIGPKPIPWLVWNASASVPTGLYRVSPPQRFAVTDLVVAKPTEPLATLLADGGYLPRGLPLIKRVLAIPGQTVCRSELVVSVDGISMGSARERDHNGRPLPAWQGCRLVASDEVFLMNWDEPSSFDGRYFGMLPISAVLGRAEPIWTSEED